MKFALEDIEVEIFLGVPEDERAQKQKILVSVYFEYDTSKAEQSDDIADTVDYFQIYQTVKNFPGEKKYKLLERFYQDLFDFLDKKFDQISNLKLKVQKFPFEDGKIILTNY